MSKLYIIDACVIIYLTRINKLNSLLNSHQIHIPKTIINEIKFYLDPDTGVRIKTNLSPYIKSSRIKILPSLNYSDLITLESQLKNIIPGGIDAGELEGLVYVNNNEDYILCSGDGPAIIAMGFLGLSEKGISLEKLIGNLRGMEHQYTEKYFKQKIKKGKTLRIQFGKLI